MQHADVIVFATPIYYYEMSGQLKTLLDRANALFPSDYAFRDIYLLASATEDEPDTDERAIHGLEGWIACYEKCRLAGTVFAGGVTEPGAIAGHPALETARAMGAAIAYEPTQEVWNHEQHPDPYAGMGQDLPAK